MNPIPDIRPRHPPSDSRPLIFLRACASILAITCFLTLSHAQSPQSSSPPSETFDLRGTVHEPPDIVGWMNQLESAMNKSLDEADQIWRKSSNSSTQPAPGVVVTLKSQGVIQNTRTDAQGSFAFVGLPLGNYEITAEAPARPAVVAGEQRTALCHKTFAVTEPQEIQQGKRKSYDVTLQLSTQWIAVSGRITDTKGQPVGNAGVTAKQGAENVSSVENKGYFETHPDRTWSSTTDADGRYTIRGIPAYSRPGYVKIAGHKALPPDSVDIHLEADGYRQPKNQVPRVPCVSEDQIRLGRRFLAIQNIALKKTGKPACEEQADATYPTSKENIITDVDVVLETIKE